MTHQELKEKLLDLVRLYFGGAAVSWGRVKLVQPHSPLISLTTVFLKRPYQPITQMINGVPTGYYPSTTGVQVDLFTRGAEPLSNKGNVTAARENTAITDLTDFVNFLNSPYVDEWSDVHDISILANQVQDLSEIINNTQWQYRAMVELEISFTQTVIGHAGIMSENGMPYYENGRKKYDSEDYLLDEKGNRMTDEHGDPLPPVSEYDYGITPSGGRTKAFAEKATGWYSQVQTPIEEDL